MSLKVFFKGDIHTSMKLFDMYVNSLNTPNPNNSLGAKGIGESGSVGTPPAVMNAVVDAVRHLGVTHIDMPATPQKIWEILHGGSK